MNGSVYTSQRLQRLLGMPVVETQDGGFNVHTRELLGSPVGNPVAYVDPRGVVHTLRGGSGYAARVRASLKRYEASGSRTSSYVNTPPHLRG